VAIQYIEGGGMSQINIEAIEKAAQEKDPAAWDMAVAAGMEARENMDSGRWIIGDIAATLRKSYGKNIFGQYAKSINVQPKTVRDYSRTARFWQKDAREELLDLYPTLTYSHFRTAMRFKDIGKATAFLVECADGAWTIERADVEASERLGKPTPQQKELDAEGTLKHADSETGVIVFQAAPGADLIKLQNYIEHEMRMALYTLEPESENENERT
jgi:hypothetical protein